MPRKARPKVDKMVAADIAPIAAPVIRNSEEYDAELLQQQQQSQAQSATSDEVPRESYSDPVRTIIGTQDVVTVEKSKSGQYWRMTYNGEQDILDHAPSGAEQTQFIRTCVAAKQRARAEAMIRAIPSGPNGGAQVKAL